MVLPDERFGVRQRRGHDSQNIRRTKKSSGADGQSLARSGRFGCSKVSFAGHAHWLFCPSAR
jgi:hypothetical protein